ncbi:MAG: phosphopantothenoylcysteine decarboxylase, partial [Myxococcota bacterium]
LDPVRFLGNRSTGRMGFAIAEAARDRGATVTLVAGPTALSAPPGIDFIAVRSATDMDAAVQARASEVDVVVMAAAVADYRPEAPADQKIKKTEGPLQLTLVRNPDILAGLGKARQGSRPTLVGFALETSDVVANAQRKLARKGADLIVANHADDGFGGSDNLVTLVDATGAEPLARMSKRGVAERILDRIQALRGSG